MVSGALLLNPTKTESLSAFFNKRFSKIAVPFITWSVFYLIWRAWLIRDIASLGQGIALFLSGPVYYHLWFMYLIIGLYLVTPILKEYVQRASQETLTYFMVIWAVWVALAFMGWFNIHVGIEIYVVAGYVGYFVGGFYFSRITISRRQMWLLLLIAFLCWIITMLGSYITSVTRSPIDGYFYDYFSPPIVVMAICTFLLVRNLPDERIARLPETTRNAIIYVAEASFKIYLIHAFILDILNSHQLRIALNDPTHISPLIGIPLDLVLTLVLCLVVIAVLRRIPIVRNVV